MEALRNRSCSTELLPKTPSPKSISYEILKDRLKRLPRVPSSIVLPDPSSQSELADDSSTIATATTSTEPESNVSTAATSVLSLPQIFTIQKFYVCPSMATDANVQAIWTRQIKARLSAVLLHSIPTGTCVQEFMMLGKRPHSLKPTVVITCGDAATKKRVEKTFKSQGWLQELLKANHIAFVALVAATPLSGGPPLKNSCAVTVNESYAVQFESSSVPTSCGLGLLASDADDRLRHQCTIGGLIVVKGVLLGLTAGHPFSKDKHNDVLRSLSDAADATEDCSDDEGSSTSSEPFIFNDDDDGDTDDDSAASSVSLRDSTDVSSTPTDQPSHNQLTNLRSASPSMKHFRSSAAILPASDLKYISSSEGVRHDFDWALLYFLPPAVTSNPNKIAHMGPRHDVPIEGVVHGPAFGDVTIIIASIGPQLGYLHSSPVTLKVDESVLEVQLITLGHGLPLGSSGAWVILEDKLCGYIVAVRQDIPWAYMVPIGPVFEDIGRKLDTNDVRLPTAYEIESSTIAFKNPPIGKANEQNEDTSASVSKLGVSNVLTYGSESLERTELANLGSRTESYRHINHTELTSGSPRAELPSVSEKYLPPELPDESVLQRSRLLDPREEEIMDEKTNIEPNASQSLTVQPTLSSHERTFRIDLPGESMLGQSAVRSPNATHRNYRRLIWGEEANNTALPLTDCKDRPQYPGSRKSRWKKSIVRAKRSTGLWLCRAVYLPPRMWHRFETFILCTEYRRRKRGWSYRSSPRFFLVSIPLLVYPRHPGYDASNVLAAMLKDIQIPLYYLCVGLWFVVGIVLNLVYLVACFPFIIWVTHRHCGVFLDEEALKKQVHGSIAMLGPLPENYNDRELMQRRFNLSLSIRERQNNEDQCSSRADVEC